MNRDYNDYNKWEKHPQPYTPNPYDHFNKEVKKVAKPLTIEDLFPRIDRWGIGIADTLHHLQGLAQEKPSYPPYNIKKFKDGKWTIELALAGFLKEQIKLEVLDRTLSVSSVGTEMTDEDWEEYEAEDIHQGIAARSFNLKFALAEYVEVDSATYVNGILKITLVTNLPEEKKPRAIEIN